MSNTILHYMITSPFIKEETKISILKSYDINDGQLQNEILSFQNIGKSKQLWFTTWQGFDFGKELDAKRSQEVY